MRAGPAPLTLDPFGGCLRTIGVFAMLLVVVRRKLIILFTPPR